jgi:hypothetical protein
MPITFEHRAFLYNTYVKNKIHTRNAVINSEENFLVCLFETGQQFTITLKYFRQQAPFQIVLEHSKDKCQLRKINKNSMLDWRNFQENHWITSQQAGLFASLAQNVTNRCTWIHVRRLWPHSTSTMQIVKQDRILRNGSFMRCVLDKLRFHTHSV